VALGGARCRCRPGQCETGGLPSCARGRAAAVRPAVVLRGATDLVDLGRGVAGRTLIEAHRDGPSRARPGMCNSRLGRQTVLAAVDVGAKNVTPVVVDLVIRGEREYWKQPRNREDSGAITRRPVQPAAGFDHLGRGAGTGVRVAQDDRDAIGSGRGASSRSS